MKEFYDIWRLRQHAFEGEALYKAVSQTLNNRRIEAIQFAVFEKVLNQSNAKQTQWTAFLTKSRVVGPDRFDELLKFKSHGNC